MKYFISNRVHETLPRWTVQKVAKKYLLFCGSRMFITMFVRVRHCMLSWASWIQSTPSHTLALCFTLIIFYHLCIVYPMVSYLQVYTFRLSHAFYIPRSSCSPWFERLVILGEEYMLWSSSLCSTLYSYLLTSSFVDPSVFLRTLLSDTLMLILRFPHRWLEQYSCGTQHSVVRMQRLDFRHE